MFQALFQIPGNRQAKDFICQSIRGAEARRLNLRLAWDASQNPGVGLGWGDKKRKYSLVGKEKGMINQRKAYSVSHDAKKF